MILPTTLYHRILTIFAAVIVLCLLGFIMSTCLHGAQSQKRDAVVSKTTGRALDKVAEQTPIIRHEQKEKENEVSAIEGSDARLPDGYGAELERVRRGKRD